jgi:hypothetical protein
LTEIQADLSRLADRTGELRKDLRRLIVEIETDHCTRDRELERANEAPERPENVFQFLKYLTNVPSYLEATLADIESNWQFGGLEIELRGLATVTESELRAIVARTTKVEELREFLRQCEANGRQADPALAERWLELAEPTSRTGEVYLDEADALRVEELGERILRIEPVAPEEDWPVADLCSPGRMDSDPDDVDPDVVDPIQAEIRREPAPRPATALRSLGALVRAWERGDLEPR